MCADSLTCQTSCHSHQLYCFCNSRPGLGYIKNLSVSEAFWVAHRCSKLLVVKDNKGPCTHLANQRACVHIVYFDLRSKENHLWKRSRPAVPDPGPGICRYNPRFSLPSPATELLLLYLAGEETVVQRDKVPWPVPSVESWAQTLVV